MRLIHHSRKKKLKLFSNSKYVFYVLNDKINEDFLKHKQANINVKSRRFGVIVTPFSRHSE